MANSNGKSGITSFIGALAGLITAVGTLLVILNQLGYLGTPKPGLTTKPKIELNQPSSPSSENSKRLKALEEKLKNLSEQEAKQKENEMLQRIAELEQQLKKKSQNKGTKVKDEIVTNLTGYWRDAISGGIYQINQFGNDISLTEYANYYGVQTITSSGSGTINGNQVKITYNTLFNTSGTVTVKISNNGSRLKGTAIDHISNVQIQLDLIKK